MEWPRRPAPSDRGWAGRTRCRSPGADAGRCPHRQMGPRPHGTSSGARKRSRRRGTLQRPKSADAGPVRWPAARRGFFKGRAGVRRGVLAELHALVDGLGNPIRVHPAAGNVNDVSQEQQLIAVAEGRLFIADEGYDANHVLEAVAQKGMTAVIASLSHRKTKRLIDGHVYKERHLVENFFCEIKRYRLVATRCEKTAMN